MRMSCPPILAFALAVSVISPPDGLAQDNGCEASVQATVDAEEQGDVKMLTFDVEVATPESCAQIEYDLILDELLPNGQTKKERLPRLVKLDDGGYDEIVKHEIQASLELRSYLAKVVSCQRCSVMP